jgi:hypothetical protein
MRHINAMLEHLLLLYLFLTSGLHRTACRKREREPNRQQWKNFR